jgi:hypothetical protein
MTDVEMPAEIEPGEVIEINSYAHRIDKNGELWVRMPVESESGETEYKTYHFIRKERAKP